MKNSCGANDPNARPSISNFGRNDEIAEKWKQKIAANPILNNLGLTISNYKQRINMTFYSMTYWNHHWSFSPLHQSKDVLDRYRKTKWTQGPGSIITVV